MTDMRIAAALFAALLLPAMLFAAEPDPQSSRVINLIIAGPVEAGWAESISKHVSDNLWTPVQLRVVPELAPTGSVAEICAAVSHGTRPGATICVACGAPPQQTPIIGCAVEPDTSSAVIWVEALKSPATSPDMDASTLVLWRVQKQALFAAARLLGKEACIFPLCVMHEDAIIEDLDIKARNLCPPCRLAMRRQLELPE